MSLLLSLLHKIDPETAHGMAMRGMSYAPDAVGRFWAPLVTSAVTQEIHGVTYDHPLGLAGGFDKNARAHGFLGAMGFSFLELGTVTPFPQAGNERPRIWRTPEGIVNRMGFPNEGVDALAERLEANECPRPVAVSIGKNLATPIERAHRDYATCAERLASLDLAYVAINVSSPNTKDLRSLQQTKSLLQIIGEVKRCCSHPIAVKLAPDLPDEVAKHLAAVALDSGVSYLILTNTLAHTTPDGHTGGLSGTKVKERALQLTRLCYRATEGQLPIIGVGGIDDAPSAWARIRAGASLLQIYTAFVDRGPSVIAEIAEGIDAFCDERPIKDFIGSDAT